MNLFIYTGASRLNAAVVESATDLTPVARLPDLIVGDSEPVTVKFLSASGAYESWSGGGTYTLSISIGTLGADGIGAYFQTSSFTAVTNGWTGRLNLASGSLPSAVAGYLADRPGAQSVPLFLQVRVTDADGNTETYARQAVAISGAVSVPTTANSTPVTYATAADVAADAATASAAAIAAAASASAASGSASTAAGHATTAGNSATAAAASAVTAGNSATTAAGSATTATTQATNAATSSSGASTYKDAAAVSAASATSSAGTATTQAALATTNGAAQVTLAAAQVTLATTQATNAGTSATAAGVSAAAALVSEAAALVSKNAAAASAATASAVSGSGNGTFSAAALTGVNSVTAASVTALTLAGGSTGASLVLGAGVNSNATLTPNGTGQIVVSDIAGTTGLSLRSIAASTNNYAFRHGAVTGTVANALTILNETTGTRVLTIGPTGNLSVGVSPSGGIGGVINATAAQPTFALANSTAYNLSPVGFMQFLSAYNGSGGLDFSGGIKAGKENTTDGDGKGFLSFWTNTSLSSPSEKARLTSTGNLLIGTTTDISGTGGLHVAGTATASTTTSGALRVGSNVGLSGNAGGASYFGGPAGTTQSAAAGDAYLFATNTDATATSRAGLQLKTGTSAEVWQLFVRNNNVFLGKSGIADYVQVGPTNFDVKATTSASSSTVGALTVGNGTAATNVAIGGGNVNAGGTIVSGNGATFTGGVTVLGTASVSQGYLSIKNAVGAREANLYNPAGGGLQIDTSGNGYPIVLNGSAISLAPSGAVTVPGSTASTNTTSGALVVTGGVGVGGAVNVGGAVKIGPAASSPSIAGSGSVTVTTSTTQLSSTPLNTGAIAVVSGYNNSGGTQGAWLIIATSGGTISTIGTANATGLTPTFSVSAGTLRMSLASGSMTVVTTLLGFPSL